MSYTPTNWQTGDIVTSEKLNKIEQELANPSSSEEQVITCYINTDNSKSTSMTSLTVQEIIDAFDDGEAVRFVLDEFEPPQYYTGCSLEVITSEGDEVCMLHIDDLAYNYIYRGTEYETSYFEIDYD